MFLTKIKWHNQGFMVRLTLPKISSYIIIRISIRKTPVLLVYIALIEIIRQVLFSFQIYRFLSFLKLPHSRVWNVHEIEAICKNLFRSRNVPRYIEINLVRRKMLYYSHTNEDGTDKEFQFIEIEMPTVYSVDKLTEAVHNFTLFNTMMVGNPDLTMSSEDESSQNMLRMT